MKCLCCSVIWSLEAEVPLSQRKQSTSLYQWMLETWISSVRVKMGVSTSCLLVSWGVHCGLTMVIVYLISYHNPTYNPQYGTNANVPAILTWNAPFVCVCVCVWRNGTHWKHALWYLWTHITASTVPILVFNCSDMKQKGSKICPHAHHSWLMQCSSD